MGDRRLTLPSRGSPYQYRDGARSTTNLLSLCHHHSEVSHIACSSLIALDRISGHKVHGSQLLISLAEAISVIKELAARTLGLPGKAHVDRVSLWFMSPSRAIRPALVYLIRKCVLS